MNLLMQLHKQSQDRSVVRKTESTPEYVSISRDSVATKGSLRLSAGLDPGGRTCCTWPGGQTCATDQNPIHSGSSVALYKLS